MPNPRTRHERSSDSSGQPPTQQTRTASAVAVCRTQACRCPYPGCTSLLKGARPLQQHLNTVHPLPGAEGPGADADDPTAAINALSLIHISEPTRPY